MMLKVVLFTVLARVLVVSAGESCDSSEEDYTYDEFSYPRCQRHEVFSNCTNGGCSPRNCSQLGFPVPCIKIDPKYCKKGCVCEEGYLRNSAGVCVLKKNCPSCGGDPNAVASKCGNNCKNTCANYKKKNVFCPKLCLLNGCECRKGYVYDDNVKKCVRPKQCTPVCNKKNEIYSDCANAGCDAKTCAQNGFKVTCVEYNSTACIKGCTCEDGYIRADNGTCILRSECPSCGGDPNAGQGCGINCGRHCSNYMMKNVRCPLRPCFINNCDCKPDFVFDDNIQRCVLPEDCTPVCKENEVYSSCANGLCRFTDCTQYGQPIPFCPRVDPSTCEGNCICIDKYLRNADGVCIPQEQCPEKWFYFKSVVFAKIKDKKRYIDSIEEKFPVSNIMLPQLALATLLTTANKSNNTTTPTQLDCSAARQRLLDGNVKFTGDFMNDLVKGNPTGSVIMSPFSVLIPMAELCLYTDEGSSYNQLMSILNLKSKDEIRCVFPEILRSFQAQKESALELATKVYVSINENLTDQFKTDSEVVFAAEGEAIDFSNPQNAADTINKWVAEKTKNRIQKLVSSAMFNSLTRLVLTNAIYFLGSWVKQFNPKSTTDRDFYVNQNVTMKMKTMYRKGSFKYADLPSLDAKAIEIPYKGGNFSYVAFLPNSNEGHVELVDKLRDPKVLNDALDQLSFKTVQVYLPRYETTSSIDLVRLLNHLNVTDLFDASKSNLNGILQNSQKLMVSAAIQKANIRVDEVGTEAAAANALVVGATAVMQSYIFNADHPFVYYIFLQRSPLFAGVLTAN